MKCLKGVKAKLPRRESERRNHKLSRHCDILTAIETRISLLSMTFLKAHVKYYTNNLVSQHSAEVQIAGVQSGSYFMVSLLTVLPVC